jgi:hypothetical protein
MTSHIQMLMFDALCVTQCWHVLVESTHKLLLLVPYVKEESENKKVNL